MTTNVSLRKHNKTTAAWLAGLISTDGSIVQNQSVGVHIYTAEQDWALQMKELIESLGLKVNLYDHPHTAGFKPGSTQYTLRLSPVYQVYKILRPVKRFMIDRKWELLENAFASRESEIENSHRAYRQILQGKSPAKIAREFEIPIGTVRGWKNKNNKPYHF